MKKGRTILQGSTKRAKLDKTANMRETDIFVVCRHRSSFILQTSPEIIRV